MRSDLALLVGAVVLAQVVMVVEWVRGHPIEYPVVAGAGTVHLGASGGPTATFSSARTPLAGSTGRGGSWTLAISAPFEGGLTGSSPVVRRWLALGL